MTCPSPTMLIGEQLAAASLLHEKVDELGSPSQFPIWAGVVRLAEGLMIQPPSSQADVLLQVATAATWMGTVSDGLEEGTTARSTALAILTALENAALFLNRTTLLPHAPAAALLGNQIVQLIACGAELDGRDELVDDRRATWWTAHERYRQAKAEADACVGTAAADGATERELSAQDDLIENVPSPDGRALALKIVMAMDRADAFENVILDDHAVAIRADARRLAGVE